MTTKSPGSATKVDVTGELAGDTVERQITVTDANGAARDLTNDTIRAEFDFDTPVILTEGSGITIDDAANGILTWKLTDEQTDAAGPGVWGYGVKVEDQNGNERTPVYGRLELLDRHVD